MTRGTSRHVLALALGLTAGLLAGPGCQGGLNYQAGNEFPCTFGGESQDPLLGDVQCPEGYACGPLNTCIPFTRDEFLEAECSSEGTVLRAPDFTQHGTVDRLPGAPLQKVAGPGHPRLGVYVGLDDGGTLYVMHRGEVTAIDAGLSPGSVKLMGQGVDPTNGTGLVFLLADNGAIVAVSEEAVAVVPPGPNHEFAMLRTVVPGLQAPDGTPRLAGVVRAGINGSAGFIVPTSTGTGLGYEPLAVNGLDGGEPFNPGTVDDLLVVPRTALMAIADGGTQPVPVVVSEVGFFHPLGPEETVWRALNDTTQEPVWELPGPRQIAARTTPQGDTWATLSRGTGPDQLSLWRLTAGNKFRLPELTRLYSECLPCEGRVEAFVPLGGANPSIEVVCGGTKAKHAVQAVLSAVAGTCELLPLQSSVDPRQMTSFDHTVGDRLVVGGATGNAWDGRSLSQLQPLFLDDVPLAAGRFPRGGMFSGELYAITGDDLAIRTDAGMASVAVRELLGTGSVAKDPQQIVRNAEGWVVLEGGEFTHFAPDGGALDIEVRFGPRMVSPDGQPASGPYQAERLAPSALFPESFIATANDSLYVWENVGATALGTTPKEGAPLLAQLTPEPNFPIRSIAVDQDYSRSDRPPVHGYLVTSRNAFDFSFGGSPRRWESRLLPLTFGEPVEVWMASATSEYGRIGFRDGSVYTLPSGLRLTEQLKEGDQVLRVIDYESIGGWPVAVTSTGVYWASGALTNCEADPTRPRYQPFTWKKVEPVPFDPAKVGLENARLVTIADGAQETLYLFAEQGRVFRLAVRKP